MNKDVITLNDTFFINERLSFGNLLLTSVSTPKQGQSIRKELTRGGYLCLDNTPTIGYENDTLNIKGKIEGFIKDSTENPIGGVKVIYDYIDVWPQPPQVLYVETDNSGYFTFFEFAKVAIIKFQKDGYFAPDTFLQIWPDSTVVLNIFMQPVVNVTELPVPHKLNFRLSQNYPNPFNNSTTFNYSLPEDGFVEINIYDEKGELIQRLFNGNQLKGEYRVNWNADKIASGIYFYELQSQNRKITRKCSLWK
jgi:hypothetical protein